MTKKIKPIILAKWGDGNNNKRVSVEDYLSFIEKQDIKNIVEFVYQRFYTRYIKPFNYPNADYKKDYKNGFSIMANCCLIIEALESFKNGWETTHNRSRDAFNSFFKSEPKFEQFKECATDFYKHIRCGILHQAETTGGWTIGRKGKTDFSKKFINATDFLKEIDIALKEYCKKLEKEKWDSEIWDNFRIKMRKVISNCEHKL